MSSSQFTSEPLRVGIVGANPAAGWARVAHVPAIAGNPGLRLTAVATTREATARAAAAAFGAEKWFTGAEALTASDDIDIVVVAVKAPAHEAVIRSAIAHGKHVYSEWPLVADLGTANELARLAHEAGVRTIVGLQGAHSPSARRVRSLIGEGRVGAVQSVALVTTTGAPTLGGSHVPAADLWRLDRRHGTTVLSVAGGGVLATLAAAVASFVSVSADLEAFYREVTVIETGETVPVDSANQFVVAGRLDNGAMASITLQGGSPFATPGFFLQIVGSKGALTVTPALPGGTFVAHPWKIRLTPADGECEIIAVEPDPELVPVGVAAGLATNVSGLYRELATAIREDRPANPDFATAASVLGLLDRIEESARVGRRVRLG
ncbi:Gfo/Idh/MocA family protein [Micromonospora sp. NPDC050397]|uniref:Gfo/Idh/MocA family protein n=1 Tax=Micromonospora sp. NPDC050397 TaxID=3364279 RepID=UPI003850E7A1